MAKHLIDRSQYEELFLLYGKKKCVYIYIFQKNICPTFNCYGMKCGICVSRVYKDARPHVGFFLPMFVPSEKNVQLPGARTHHFFRALSILQLLSAQK